MRECTEALFLKDVSQHEMTVIRDDSLHRHVRFARPGTNCMSFNLITWPGSLCYTGDMGTYVFSRVADMFEFFRDKGEGPLRINESYWAEKLDATDRPDGHTKYSTDKFRAYVADQLEQFKEHLEQDADRYEKTEDEIAAAVSSKFAELKQAVEEDVLSLAEDGEHAVYEALRDFEHGDRNWFPDYWEASFREYTFRFIWCCYALAWAIRTYDAARTAVNGDASR